MMTSHSGIAELEKAVQLAKVSDRPDMAEGAAYLGSKIKLHDLDLDDEFTVTLVGVQPV